MLQTQSDFEIVTPIVAAMPLVVIVLLTACKDAFEDYRRHVNDAQQNNQKVLTIPNIKNQNKIFFANTSTASKWRKLFGVDWIVDKFRKHILLNRLSRVSRKISPVRSVDYEASAENLANMEKIGIDGRRVYPPDESTCLDWNEIKWEDIKVGDFVFLRNEEPIPADVFLFSTSQPDAMCFVETKTLDGETNLKIKRGIVETSYIKRPSECSRLKAYVNMEVPNPSLYTFSGSMVIPNKYIRHYFEQSSVSGMEIEIGIAEDDMCSDDEANTINQKSDVSLSHPKKVDKPSISESSEIIIPPFLETSLNGADPFDAAMVHDIEIPINIDNILLRGCTVKNTEWVIGLVIATGADTKLRMNAGPTPSKQSRIEVAMNKHV